MKLIVDMEENKDNTAFAQYLHGKFLSQSASIVSERKVLEFIAGTPSFVFDKQDGLACLLTKFYEKVQPFFFAIDRAEWATKWGDKRPVDSVQSVVKGDERAAAAWQDVLRRRARNKLPNNANATATRQGQGPNLLDLKHDDLLDIWLSIPEDIPWSMDKTPDQFSNLPRICVHSTMTGSTGSERETTSSSDPPPEKRQKTSR